MRVPSLVPRLPPVRSSVGNAGGLSDASQSGLKQQPATTSSLQTSAHTSSTDAWHSTSKSNSDEFESPHTNPTNSGSQRSSSHWARQFRTQSKGEFVHGDMKPLLERFEDTALYRQSNRKSLQTVLDEMNSKAGSLCRQSSSIAMSGGKLSVLRRQASDLMEIRRVHRQNTVADAAKVLLKQNFHERVKASALEPPPKIVPTRFLFDGTRWSRSSRCDYCNFAGGELECAMCNVVAHARCYLSAYEREDRKSKLTFVVPASTTTDSPFSFWLCSHCHSGLTLEYDERSADARAEHLAAQRQVLANALTAYVRMIRDAATFATKRASIVKIQAVMRGRIARQRFVQVQRTRLKPYAIDSLRVHANFPFGTSGNLTEGLGLGIGSSSSLEELRLGNGFSCNPFLYVSVVAGNDEDTQLFCFETSVRKPTTIGEAAGPAELDIAWSEKIFVPGADGNATFCFTLLSKNGPNTFFLGQAVLRLLDAGESWRTGLATELELMEHVEIFPKTAQHQPLPLTDPGGSTSTLIHDFDNNSFDDGTPATKRKPRWVINVNVRPFSEQHSLCGYLNMKTTLESFHTSARWCVLADGVLRIYRHFGVTLASDVIDMARATDVRVVAITGNKGLMKSQHSPGEDGTESVASTRLTSLAVTRSVKKGKGHRLAPGLAEHCCLAIHHLSRLYLFQCDQNEHLREWLKKLQGAQKFSSISSQVHLSTTTAVNGNVALQ